MSLTLPRLEFVNRGPIRVLFFLLLSFLSWQIIHATSRIVVEPWYKNSKIHHGILDLVEHCPKPHEEISEECKSAMADYFSDVPLEFSDTTWISIPNRLTYGRAFENPAGDRKRVLKALNQEECLLKGDPTVRWDLKDSCHADAFANLSVLLWACDERPDIQDRGEALVDLIDKAHLAEDPQRHEERVQYGIVRFLEARWFGDKCAEHKPSALRFAAHRDPTAYETLRAAASRFGEPWVSSSNVPETFVLKAIAARLGDESTALRYFPLGSKASGRSWDDHIRKVWPWKSDLPSRASTLEDFFEGPKDAEARMLNGLSVAIGLQESGFEFDWNTLVRSLCKLEETDEHATCRSVITQLKRSLDWNQKRELKILEKFESVSIELGLYE
ncbi:MAG: hypothetical protein OXG08_00680 [Gammaproteobacteria bacterium]|nr:hypothetical protein [Gammaproteobacteria bacterium]